MPRKFNARHRKRGKRARPALRRVIKRTIKSMAEQKFRDVNLATLSLTPTAVVTDLFLPSEGVGREERVGDQCSIQKVMLNYMLLPVDLVIPQVVRIIMIQWKEDSAVDVPLLTDILTDTATNPIISHTLHAMRKKYTIMYDATHALPRCTAEAECKRVVRKIVRIPSSKKVRFNRSAATGQNKIFLLTFTNADATADVAMDINCRVFFVDL